MSFLPPARPRLSSEELSLKLKSAFGQVELDKFMDHPIRVAGIRGYYKSMGTPGANDRMIYDDAIFLWTANAFVSCNGNTDPNGFRTGRGTGSNKGIAKLNTGIWNVYKFDLHRNSYLALCQRAGEVTVTRDGNPPYGDTGDFGINIHRGSNNSTSSLGCQTIPPSQWDAFITLAYSEAQRVWGGNWRNWLNKAGKVVPYALVEE